MGGRRQAQAYGREEFSAYWSLKAADRIVSSSTTIRSGSIRSACWSDDRMVGVQPPRAARCSTTPTWRSSSRSCIPTTVAAASAPRCWRPTLDRVRAEGRTTVLAEVSMPFVDPPSSPGSLFAEKHGFSIASLEIHRVLDLPVPPITSTQLAAGIGDRADGYELVTLRGPGARRAGRGFCALQIAFNSEAPMGEMDLEPEVWDEDRVRSSEERSSARVGTSGDGRDRSGRHDGRPDGDDGDRRADRPRLARRHAGAREHRGHRLGLATKIANLRAFMADFPDVRRVHSWNAEENARWWRSTMRSGFGRSSTSPRCSSSSELRLRDCIELAWS